VRGDDQPRCLRRGHIGAAATLTVAADSAAPPPADVLDALLGCSESDWAATIVTADGFSLGKVE
jgi:2-dehydro-3-deoxygluconokinase